MSERRKYAIELPVPHRVLWGNGRTRNHRYLAAMVKQHRVAARWQANGHGIDPPMQFARVDLLFRFVHRRQRDDQNLIHAVKAYIDGLEDAGVIANDSGVRWGVVRKTKGAEHKADERVRIQLTEIGEDGEGWHDATPIDPTEHIGMVYHAANMVAQKWGSGVDRDELLAAGWYALDKCLWTFDPSRGYTFSTYAMRAMQREMFAQLRGSPHTNRQRPWHAIAVDPATMAAMDSDTKTPQPIDVAARREAQMLVRQKIEDLDRPAHRQLSLMLGKLGQMQLVNKALGLSRNAMNERRKQMHEYLPDTLQRLAEDGTRPNGKRRRKPKRSKGGA